MSGDSRLSDKASGQTMSGDPNHLPCPRPALYRITFGAGTERATHTPDRADGIRTIPIHMALSAVAAGATTAGDRHFRGGS